METLQEATHTENFHKKNDIFLDSRNICIEYALATGGELPNYENLEALYLNDFLAYSPEEILDACECEDMEDFHDFMTPWCDDELIAERHQKEILITEIEAKKSNLPEKLFKVVEKDRGRGVIIDEEVSDDEKLARYARWKVLASLRRDPSSEKDMSDESLVHILLGLAATTGALRAGFPSNFLDRRKNVTLGDIESRAQGLGFTDYIYPDLQEKINSTILEASKLPGFIALEKSSSLHKKLAKLNKLHYFIDIEKKNLLLDEDSIEKYLKNNNIKNKKYIYNLGELLIDKNVSLPASRVGEKSFKEWQSEDCYSYILWLRKIVEPYSMNVDREALRRASKLSIGPGVKLLLSKTQADTLGECFSSLGIVNRRPKNQFDDLVFEDYVSIVREVAKENEGKVTKDILRQRIREGYDDPPLKRYAQVGGFSIVLSAAGIEVHNEKLSEEICLSAGEEYFNKTGEMPTSYAMKRKRFPYSDRTIYSYFGSMPNFHNAIERRLARGKEQQSDGKDLELIAV